MGWLGVLTRTLFFFILVGYDMPVYGMPNTKAESSFTSSAFVVDNDAIHMRPTFRDSLGIFVKSMKIIWQDKASNISRQNGMIKVLRRALSYHFNAIREVEIIFWPDEDSGSNINLNRRASANIF